MAGERPAAPHVTERAIAEGGLMAEAETPCGIEDARAANLLDRPVVLFDFDGTLANTAPLVMKLAERTLAENGFTREQMGDLRRIVGPPLVDGFRDIFGLTQEEAERITGEYRRRFDTEAVPEDYPLMPGVADLLELLSQAGKRLAVATSRREGGARTMVAALGIDRYFETVMGLLEPVRHTKADSIRCALDALGAAPDDALMVGDRYHDVEGAHEVGVPCIGLSAGAAAPGELEAAGADLVLPAITDLLALFRGHLAADGRA